MTDVPSQLDVRALLAEQDSVRRLAHSLVFDAQRVDDVVQDAWLAAVRRPPREHAAAFGWFRSVLHHLARRRARDEARRTGRERAAARPEALPSAADVLLREERRRDVVDAVLALPEPYRGTVLARFFDGLEPAAIARARAVPAATVRSHLHRALELLRQRLDERHGGRQAWGLWLLPLARPVHTTGTGGLAAMGALLMAKILLGAGALALAVLGLLWLGGGTPPPAVPDVATAANACEVAAAATTPPPAPDPAPAQRVAIDAPQSPRAAPASRAAGLRGRVVQPDGTPVPGCLVRVLGIDGAALFADAPATGDDRTLALVRGQARTCDDGTFAIDGLAPRARCAVHADADGPDRTLRLCDATPLPGETADLGDVVLEPKGSIAGRAVDGDGAPVAGAEVMAFDLPPLLAGVLPFDRFDPRHGGMLALPTPDAALAADPAAWREVLNDHLARDLFVRADLDREDALCTFVVDRLPWLETLWNELPVARTTTAADGTFELRGVEPGQNLLVVRGAGLASGRRANVAVTARARQDVGDVRCGTGEELRGVVRDADGAPVAGAEVRVGSIGALGYRGVAFCEAPATTDGGGAFRVAGLGRGRAMVAVRRSPAEPWHVTGPVATGDDVDVALPLRTELTVRVATADGGAPAGLSLQLFAGPFLHELRRAGLQQRLPLPDPLPRDADGTLHLGALPPGCYTLHVEAEGALPREAMVVLPQQEPASIVLEASSSLLLRVRDAAGGPVAGARVLVLCDGDANQRVMPASYGLPRWDVLPTDAGATNASGELRLCCAAAGARLVATHPAHAPGTVRVPPGALAAAIAMPQAGRIEGRVFDQGVPADPRRWVVVAAPAYDGDVPLPELRATLAADGTFAFASVAPSDYMVTAQPIAREALSLQRLVAGIESLVQPTFFADPGPVEHHVAVAAGAVATVAFDIDPNRPKPGEAGARLSGRALVDGVPIAGALLERQLELWRWVTVATVGADGSFAAEAVPPGAHRLRLRMPPAFQPMWEGQVTLQGGAPNVLDLALATGRVQGVAAFDNGMTTAADYRAYATGSCRGGTVERVTEVDAAGRFAFPALPAGDYEVTVRGPDGTSEPARTHIDAGVQAPPLRLVLHEVPVLAGRVVDPPAGAMLLVREENGLRGERLRDDGSFHLSDLQPGTCELRLQVFSRQIALDPGTFDLRLGSRRDLVLRCVPAK